MIKIDALALGPMGVNSYIVREEHSRECALIDPADAEPILEFLTRNGLTATHILLTHGHFDHIIGVAELKERTGATIYIHENDARALYDDEESLANACGYSVRPSRADKLLHGGEVIGAAGLVFDVLFTPGHSPGGVCYVVKSGRAIFSGDTLFKLSVGRTDFANSSEDALFNSIENGLFALEGDYKVYPGHMRETTLDFERRHNPFLMRKKGVL